jgi:hypothetical protein
MTRSAARMQVPVQNIAGCEGGAASSSVTNCPDIPHVSTLNTSFRSLNDGLTLNVLVEEGVDHGDSTTSTTSEDNGNLV